MVILPAVAPAAVAAVAWHSSSGFEFAQGAAFRKERSGFDVRAFFDLASITKSFVSTAVARLVRRGRLSFDTPLREVLPEARASVTGDASIALLLSHRAGLEAHRALYAPLLSGSAIARSSAIAEMLGARRAEPMPVGGYGPVYSDLGFALVGLALESLEGLALDQIIST